MIQAVSLNQQAMRHKKREVIKLIIVDKKTAKRFLLGGRNRIKVSGFPQVTRLP